MSTTSIAYQHRSFAGRPPLEMIVGTLALRLLAWSERRADAPRPTARQLAAIAGDAHRRRARDEQNARVWASAPYRR